LSPVGGWKRGVMGLCVCVRVRVRVRVKVRARARARARVRVSRGSHRAGHLVLRLLLLLLRLNG
jgi:cytochrome b561